MDSFEKAEFYLKGASNEEINSLIGKEWSDAGYDIKVSDSGKNIEIDFTSFATDKISLDKSQISKEIAAKITSIFETIEEKKLYKAQESKLETNNTVVYSDAKYSLQGTTQGRYLTGGIPLVRFSM